MDIIWWWCRCCMGWKYEFCNGW